MRDHRTDYEVDANGIIRSPGKFEGEMLYVPAFWEAILSGAGDTYYDTYYDGRQTPINFLEITDEERRDYPELGTIYGIALWESDEGFVYTQEFNTREDMDKTIDLLDETNEAEGE